MKIVSTPRPGTSPELSFEDDSGNFLAPAQGVYRLREEFGMKYPLDLANAIIKEGGPEVSGRTVESWEQGRYTPRDNSMLAMQQLLEDHNKRAARKARR